MFRFSGATRLTAAAVSIRRSLDTSFLLYSCVPRVVLSERLSADVDPLFASDMF